MSPRSSLLLALLLCAPSAGCPSPSAPPDPPTDDDDATANDDDSATPSDDADQDGWTALDGDCDDSDPLVHPAADEVCDPLDRDEDCDGAADDLDPEGALGQVTVYVDEDGDGFGRFGTATPRCDVPAGAALQDGDCDDSAANSHPGAPLLCDGEDNDCDGLVTDDGLVTVVATGVTGTSIQGALDVAPTGGTVHVCAGTYPERLTISRPVVLQGLAGQTATFIDAGGSGRGVTVTADSVIITDLTIQAGAADEGAGLLASGLGSLTLISCTFLRGAAVGQGGGVLLRDVASFTLSDLRVLDGTASQGGGVALVGSSGLALDLIARANAADQGGALYVDGGAPVVENALFELNSASVAGGGVFAATSLQLFDADLFENSAPSGAAFEVQGGTLSLEDGSVRRNVSGSGGVLHVHTDAAVSNVSWGLGADDNAPADVSVSGGGTWSFGAFEDFTCAGDLSSQAPLGCF